MKTFDLIGEVDEQHRLQVLLPEDAAPGTVRVIVLVPEDRESQAEPAIADAVWMRSVAREWQAELADEREDIYTLEDGEPSDAAR